MATQHKSLIMSALEKCIKNTTYDEDWFSIWDSVPDQDCNEIAEEFGGLVTGLRVKLALLNATQGLTRTNSRKLTTKEVESLAVMAYVYFENFPHNYSFVLPLPRGKTPIGRVTLSSEVTIQSLSQAEVDSYLDSGMKMPIVNPYPLRENSIALVKDQNILQVTTNGFVNNLTDQVLFGLDPFYTYKIIMALYMCFNVLQHMPRFLFRPENNSYSFYCFYTDSAGLQYTRTFEESADDNKLLMDYRFDISSTSNFNAANSAITRLLKHEENKQVSKVQKELKNSLYWYYEAAQVHLPHLRPVFLVTAFDAFFASKDTQNQIANLIAMSLATDAVNEHTIREDIGQLYNLRNKIVHGEKTIGVYNQNPDAQDEEDSLVLRCTDYLRSFIVKRATILTSTK